MCVCVCSREQEGVGQEALSLGGHLGLGNLIAVYDDNKISIDGEARLKIMYHLRVLWEKLTEVMWS